MMALAVLVVLAGMATYAHAQEYYDTPQSLTVEIIGGSQYVYQEDGHTIVVGEVQNDDPQASISGVRLEARFFDYTGTVPVAVVQGGTVLDVIPPGSKSPFVMRAADPDGIIRDVSVLLGGFDGSADKSGALTVHSTDISHGKGLRVGGEVRNGMAPELNVTAHAVIYDNFDPPRVLRVESYGLGNMLPNSRASFVLEGDAVPGAVSLVLMAESDSSYAPGRALVPIPPREERAVAQITEVKLDGKAAGMPVQIGGIIEHVAGPESEYVFYAQVKVAGDIPYVAFLGSSSGTLGDGGAHIEWVPEAAGLYFVETFVWGANGGALGEQGPFVLVLVE